MTEPRQDLSHLAQAGERAARPWPPDRVRAVGERRGRRRRALVGAGTVAGVAVLAAAVGFGLRGGPTVAQAPVASSPSAGASSTTRAPAAAPARGLTTANLLSSDDVPLEDYDTQQAKVAPEGLGRPLAESSVCLPGGALQQLGANQVLSRNFRYISVGGAKPMPGDPLTGQPAIYTEAFQFAGSTAARQGRDRYREWLAGCARLLQAKGYQVIPDLGFDSTKVQVPYGSALVSEIVYRRPGGADGRNAFWESTGLVLVKDRLMVTTFLHHGVDFQVSLDASEGDLMHPQLTLVNSAADRLAR